MSARLPVGLIAEHPRVVEELRTGETGHITFTEMQVDDDHNCSVNVRAKS